ncbi:MAG: DUF3667 domain-containing protein [Alphaproteobacteria bacterium]|nr:DUF3667 domain-containing protein [Alphaproteobacteria bacterium]
MKTLPDLLFRPGRLTRSYLDGHRAPQVPPLRLFLVVLVALFLVGLNVGGSVPPQLEMPLNKQAAIKRIEADRNIAPKDKEEIVGDISKAQVEFGNDQNKTDAAALWLKARIMNALAHRQQFWQAVQNWAERFAFLMLPLSSILLGILFIFNRRFYLYDHIVFSMHSLSFVCILLASMFLWDRYVPLTLGGWPLLAAPVHLYAHMRGVYRTTVLGTLLRMFLLFIGTAIGATFIVLGLLWVALTSMGPS